MSLSPRESAKVPNNWRFILQRLGMHQGTKVPRNSTDRAAHGKAGGQLRSCADLPAALTNRAAPGHIEGHFIMAWLADLGTTRAVPSLDAMRYCN